MNTNSAEQPPVLVIAYGNPSRGDDALGPEMFELLERYKQESGHLDNIDLLTDYQLQIEHSIDIEQHDCVLFIDACTRAAPPYEFKRLKPERDHSYTSHALSPAAVLEVYRQILQEPPPAYMLSIRGYEFDLGRPLSAHASSNLQKGFVFAKQLLSTPFENWNEKHII